MDKPLIFGYHSCSVISEGGTQEDRHRPVLEVGVQASRGISQANPGGCYLREATGRPSGRKRADSTLPRKTSS